jgi:hypothetical protein
MTISNTIGPFRRFFDISVSHSFFGDAICRRLKWVPTAAAWQTMDNTGMLFRTIEGGMAVYWDTCRKQAMALLAAQADNHVSGLVFKAYAGDPVFKLYTDYPQTGAEDLLFLGTDHTGSDRSGVIRLHPKPLISDQEMVPLDKLHEWGVLNRNDRGTPPVLVVRINPVGGDESPMDPKGAIRQRHYRINFDSRRTYWKYYVLGPPATQAVFIVDPDRQCNFDRAPIDPIVGDRPAAAFISSAPIPLREIPVARFQLKIASGKREKIIIQRLPVAPVNRVYRDLHNFGKAMISEIFIHL